MRPVWMRITAFCMVAGLGSLMARGSPYAAYWSALVVVAGIAAVWSFTRLVQEAREGSERSRTRPSSSV